MRVHFFLNGDDYYTTNEIISLIKFKAELIYCIESTLQWEYGNKRDFYNWMEQKGLGRHAGCFTVSGCKIDVVYHVELSTVKAFLKAWNDDFGDSQLLEYKISY